MISGSFTTRRRSLFCSAPFLFVQSDQILNCAPFSTPLWLDACSDVLAPITMTQQIASLMNPPVTPDLIRVSSKDLPFKRLSILGNGPTRTKRSYPGVV